MTSTTFFIIFIPILAILLLAINLLLAPHNPYQEKDSVFECGFHSFLGQNRTQFSISFFIFGLLFLLFDLEILLVYPYSVSSYTNDIYGLVIMMVFFVLLTLGFIFELGKNALTIDSRQTLFNNGDLSTPHVFLDLSRFNVLKSSNLLEDMVTQMAKYVDNLSTISTSKKLAKHCKETNSTPLEVCEKTTSIVKKIKGQIDSQAAKELAEPNITPEIESAVRNVMNEASILKDTSTSLLLEAIEALSNAGGF